MLRKSDSGKAFPVLRQDGPAPSQRAPGRRVFGEHVAQAACGQAQGMAVVFQQADAALRQLLREPQGEHLPGGQGLSGGHFR